MNTRALLDVVRSGRDFLAERDEAEAVALHGPLRLCTLAELREVRATLVGANAVSAHVSQDGRRTVIDFPTNGGRT